MTRAAGNAASRFRVLELDGLGEDMTDIDEVIYLWALTEGKLVVVTLVVIIIL